MIRTEQLSKRYLLGNTEVPALAGIDLHVAAGEFTAVSGPSGSGKTTLLNLIGCLDVPTSGSLTLDGQLIGYNGLARLHRLRLEKIGFIFQTFNLIPVLTAYENVEYPLLLTRRTSGEIRKLVEAALQAVGLWQVHRHRPDELSGGQRQRVAVARALVNRPRIVLADEPTANLDSQTAIEVVDMMHELNRKEAVTFLFSTHDPFIVQRAGRVVKLRDGRLVDGSAASEETSNTHRHPVQPTFEKGEPG
ncbi:MAG: ABC transporter ATP-binding protein [bacterium]